MEVGGEAGRTGMTVPIESHINFIPKSGQWLREVGITTIAEFERLRPWAGSLSHSARFFGYRRPLPQGRPSSPTTSSTAFKQKKARNPKEYHGYHPFPSVFQKIIPSICFLNKVDHKISAAHQMNIFSSIPADLPQELTETLVQAKHVRIERIVSQGHSSPEGFWYDQKENEFILLIQGEARLRFEDSVVEMKVGDWIDIPAHRKHRVEWTTPDVRTVWLAVFYA